MDDEGDSRTHQRTRVESGGRDPPYAPDPSPPPTATRGTAPSPSKLRVTALHAPPLNGPRGSREHRRARENFD